MQNPFEIFDKRLSIIESLLIDLKINTTRTDSKASEVYPTFNKIPIQEIFRQKLMSKPNFYEKVKAGTIILYKMGNRSYVDREQFNEAFHGVKLNDIHPCLTPKKK
jgi:hypothetical protein